MCKKIKKALTKGISKKSKNRNPIITQARHNSHTKQGKTYPLDNLNIKAQDISGKAFTLCRFNSLNTTANTPFYCVVFLYPFFALFMGAKGMKPYGLLVRCASLLTCPFALSQCLTAQQSINNEKDKL